MALAATLLGGACAPKKDRNPVTEPSVTVTSVVTLAPDASGTSIVTDTRPEAYVGESLGLSPSESACLVEQLAAAGIPERFVFSAPSDETRQRVLTMMRDCLEDG